MDEHAKTLALRLIELAGDDDLWTRLQALKTLRQWFYRTNNPALSRRIVETNIARMAGADIPVVRKNLSEGLYIMLDENLGGGVSLQKNVEQLPQKMRPRILEARRVFEREVLFSPILAALASGNEREKAGILEAFDGSFFKGRFFARQPEAMIDVGNDREFGFLFEPELGALETVFIPLVKAQLPSESRKQSLQLAAFFKVLERSQSPDLQMAVLERLSDSDPGVAEAARTLVSASLDPRGAESDPRRIALLRKLLESNAQSRAAVLEAIGRNSRLAADPQILSTIRKLIAQPEAAPSLLPVLKWPVLADNLVLSLLDQSWPRLSQPQRLAAIDVLVGRPALVDRSDPSESALSVLRRGVTDSSPAVRERTLRGLSGLAALWSGRAATGLLLSALADDTPALRRQGLAAGARRTGLWNRPDAIEHLKRLLVDPDAQVRALALTVVEENRLLGTSKDAAAKTGPLARRVKAAAADPGLRSRALGLLEASGFDPAAIVPDVKLGQSRLLSFSTFRKHVNPLFYQAGDDQQACANCHGNHTILRIAEAPAAGATDVDQLMINFNSALKVVNLGEPEASLILRKPRIAPMVPAGPTRRARPV